MKCELALITEYKTSMGPWITHKVVRPAFEEIETSLRRLDGDLFPSLSLFVSLSAIEDSVPDFAVLGGNGGYYIEVIICGKTYCYYDGSASTRTIPVWISDQGAELPAQVVCPNLEQLIAAVRHFYFTGGLVEEFPWHSK